MYLQQTTNKMYILIYLTMSFCLKMCSFSIALHRNWQCHLTSRGSQEASAPLQRLAVELFGFRPLSLRLSAAGTSEANVRLIQVTQMVAFDKGTIGI